MRAYAPLRSRTLEIAISLGVFVLCSAITLVVAFGSYYVAFPTWLWVLSLVQILVTLFIGVFFMSWFKRAYWNASAVEPGSDRFEHRWAKSAWFVPVLNLYRPLQMMHDVWRAARLGNEALPVVWWLAFQGWGWVTFAFYWLERDWALAVLSQLLGLVAAIFALVVVIEVTRGLDRRRDEREEPSAPRFARGAAAQLEALGLDQ